MKYSPFRTIHAMIIMCFSVLILVALTIFSGISMKYTKDTVLQNSIDYTSRLVNQVNSDIDYYINYMKNISTMVIENSDVQDYFFGTGSKEEKLQLYRRILTQFQTVGKTREDIANIAVVTKDGRSIINQGQDHLNPNIQLDEVDWYREAFACEDYILTSSHVQYVIQNNYKWVVTLSRPIRMNKSEDPIGVFFIDLNYKLLKDLCEQNSLGFNSYIFIMDENGNIIYHPKQQLLFRNLKTERIEEVLACEESSFVNGKGKNSTLYTISKSEETGWRVVGVVELASLMQNERETQKLYIAVAVGLICAGILLAVLVAGAITRPMKVLRKSMKEVEKGNFENAIIEHMPNNEIGLLGNSFNIMTARIRQLMAENIYEQKQKRKSELRALRSQMNPHFLYNTLDSIIWMAEGGKNKEVVIMTSMLAKLLRQSISNEDEMIPLQREISYVKSYLTIQKMRYNDKLEFAIHVDKEIEQEMMINLILQPLVENAIYHGIKKKDGKGMIVITGKQDGEDILLEVEDNGAGMDQETLQHIFEKSKAHELEKSNGVGVYNVHMRLRLYYGEKYGLTFYSEEGLGTKVVARLAKLEDSEGIQP